MPQVPQPIELLAPARDVVCGREAILHGADAVYIGGPDFGARAAAGNSVDDIAGLCQFAHIYGARVYVTLNTILYDNELPEAERLIWALYRAGVDALIVQDVALLSLHLPPIALHASTQMDTCTPQRAQWLEAAGYRQIVVARELSLTDIRAIAQSVSVPIEAFVHGALCVSYSGRCYASQHCFGRSANRGRCAQFCRLAFDLTDGHGRLIEQGRHLLSLPDMNRTDDLEAMMDAGVRSFKIEGRLKDVEYVKNVTAWYRQHLDAILARRADAYRRASFGTSQLTFAPDVARSFNRGFTSYFLHGRTPQPLFTYHTPKAMGPCIASVVRCDARGITVKATTPLAAGDGLCYLDAQGRLQGFRVNKVTGDVVQPATPQRLPRGTRLHRSQDAAFSRLMARPTATRTLAATLTLREVPAGYAIDMADESGCHATCLFSSTHEAARAPQREAISRTLAKLGGTPFTAERIEVLTQGERFIPASQLTEWRRQVVDALLRAHRAAYVPDRPAPRHDERLQPLTPAALDFTANVANRTARSLLAALGATSIAPAYEVQAPHGQHVVMTCRHCIRHDLGCCFKEHPDRARSLPEPLTLHLPDGRAFPLRFDCARCEMQVLATTTPR